MSDLYAYTAQPVLLEKLQYAAKAALPASVRQTMDVSVWQDDLLDHLIVTLKAGIYAQQIASGTVTESREVIVQTPATTWQMFKNCHAQSWWLRWFVQRRPVQMEKHRRKVILTAEWKGYASFPDASLVLQNDRLGNPVYQLQRNISWSEQS